MIVSLNTSPAWAIEKVPGYFSQTAIATQGAIWGLVVGAKKYIVSVESKDSRATVSTRVFGEYEFSPKTKLGIALWEARKRIIANREPLVPAKKLIADLAALRSS